MRDLRPLLHTIQALHAEVRGEIVAATERRSLEAMAAIDRDDAGDTIYTIDTISESIVERFAQALARDRSTPRAPTRPRPTAGSWWTRSTAPAA
jgi:hypothetical protein